MRLAKIASIAKQTSKKIVNLSLAAVIGVSGLAVAAPVLFAQPVSALSNTLYVANSGSDTSNDCLTQASPCQTINYAISQANGGDTVSVDAGTYTENVVVNKAVTLTGAGSSTTKIVATDANSSPLTFASNGATVSGFTITHDYTQSELSAWNFNNNGVTFNQLADNNTLENSTVTLNRNGVYLNNSESNVITGNTITNNRTGINMVNDLAGTTITGNTISDNWTEGLVTYGSSIPVNYSLITVSGNTFDNNWYEEVTVKDASNNSGTLDVSGNTFTDSPVTYSTSSDSSLNEPGFAAQQPTSLGGTATQPTTALPTLRIYNSAPVVLKYDSAKTINVLAGQSIQDAVDLATSGDTINVAAGTYDGFSVVNKTNLTIAGAGSGSTIIAPTTLVDSHTTHKYTTDMKVSVFVNNSTGVTLQGITVKDNGSAPGAGGPDALVFWNASSGTIKDSSITGTYTINGVQSGQGIAVDASGSQNASLSVSNLSISGFQKNAIDVINGNGGSATGTVSLTVSNSTITGAGSTGAIAQNGIVLWDRGGGTVTGTVTGTTFSGFEYTPLDIADGNYASDILTYGTSSSVTVSNSSFASSDIAVANATSSGSATATSNYWGISTSPSSLVSGSVSYDPWYTNSAKTTLSNNTVTDATYSSTTSGQADLPSGVTQVTLDDSHTLDVSGGVNTASGNTIVIGGTTQDLSNYTSGNLTSGVDLTTPQTIDGQSVTVGKAVVIQSGTSNQPITLTNTNVSTVSVSIPDSTTVLAPSSWDGTIAPPKSTSTSGTNAPSGFSVGSTAIEVGSPNTVLLFDKPVSVELDGVTGQVGYRAAGSNDWVLISQCTNNDYNTPQDPGFPGACSVTNGVNTIIWTYHFTSFASLTSSTSNSSSSSSSSTSTASSSNKSSTGSTGSTSGTPEVLGNSTSTPNSATSSTSVTKPAIATAATAAPKSGKILGVQWYIWLIALAALAVAAYSANYVRTTTTTSKKK